MIVALVTPAHTYTFEAMRKPLRSLRIMAYSAAFHARALPRATYLFCDLDRLNYWELELAAKLYRLLQQAGVRVLNDPARVRQRHALLRLLKERGLNDFDAWLPDHGEWPDRFPVFLRTQASHRGPLTGLLNTRAEAEAAVEAYVAKGFPRKDLMFVEYCAEANAQGVFRKLSVYRVGAIYAPALAVHERSWAAKHGEIGVAGDAGYEDERDIVGANRYATAMAPVFELAEIEYGRADFAIARGRIQTYEVNSNPMLHGVEPHPSPLRMETQREVVARLIAAFEAVDTPAGGPSVALDDEVFARQRHQDGLRPWTYWSA